MKPAVVAFIALISVLSYSVSAASVKDLKPRRSRSEVAERVRSAANVIADAVVKLLWQNVEDRLPLPDARRNFTLEIWVAKFDGVLYLTNGWLRDLKTMLRSGEADVQFDGDLVHITTNLDFSTLHLDYNYRVTVMGLEPAGGLQGTAEGLRLALHLTADLTTFRTTLSSLSVINAAKTEVAVQGGGAQDDIVNIIIRLVKPYFEQDILNFLEERIRSTLEEALIDFDISEILGL